MLFKKLQWLSGDKKLVRANFLASRVKQDRLRQKQMAKLISELMKKPGWKIIRMQNMHNAVVIYSKIMQI